MGPRPNLASAPPNAYVGSPLRPGGPGMNQSMGPMKRQSDSRVSNQPQLEGCPTMLPILGMQRCQTLRERRMVL